MPDLPDRLLVAGAYAAARRGPAAMVVDPLRQGWAPAGVVLADLVDRLTPALDAADDGDVVRTLLAARLRRGSGADRQRALWRQGDKRTFVQTLANICAGVD